MLSRRTLFARLSAVALAPLAKWLPKEEPIWFTGTVTRVTYFRKPLTAAQVATYYDAGCEISIVDGVISCDDDGVVITGFGVLSMPVPQEEA